VARHIFQACPVWIYTQSNITNIICYIIIQSIHINYHTVIYDGCTFTCISEVIYLQVQVIFLLLVRIFPLNFSFYLNYYNCLFSFLGKYFLRSQKFSWTNGPAWSDTFPNPASREHLSSFNGQLAC
jgi:hypothetical protein